MTMTIFRFGFSMLFLAHVAAADTASLTRDAVAEWRAGEAAPTRAPAVAGKAMTLCVRLRTSDIPKVGELLGWKGRGGRAAVRLYCGQSAGKQSLLAELATDARDRALQLAMPREALGTETSHVIVLRYAGHKLDLFADGVLVDEEWPLGALLPADGPMKIGPAVEHVALWNRVLSDDEVLTLSGGRTDLLARELHMLGPQRPVGQYWRPRGFNVNVGDCMPFFHEGRFHLFYLFDRRHHQSKWRLGAHQWAHVSTPDLVRWEHHPMAVAITQEMEGSICTGSTFFRDGTYHAFYAVRMSDGSPAQLCAATSADGVHFTKNPPLATLKAPYAPGPGRDPVLFRDETTKLFHMLVTTELANPPLAGRGGCLAQLVSRDLKQWEQREPFIVPGYPDQPECPDYFEWHGWYYLVFSNHGVARYRMSRQPLGPWLRPKMDVFDGPQARVMKTAAFTGDRRLGAAFLPAGGYGGEVVFREIIQHADGTLGTKWPAEMIPAAGPSSAARTVKLSAPQGLEAASLGNVPRDFLLRARVRPVANASYFGLRLRAADKMRGGTELRFEPRREKAGLRAADTSSSDESEQTSIYDVTGLDQPFVFELIVKGDIADLCVDGRRTLVTRIGASHDAGLFLFAQNAEVVFEAIEIRPLN
ncbi:MAG: glycosyl hydrolase [Verrucomicrobiia bacterium]